jgi:hypothetical protein
VTSLPLAQAIDGLMAATALVYDYALVTRNIDDVASTGVRSPERVRRGIANKSNTGTLPAFGHCPKGKIFLFRRGAVGRPYPS